MPATISEGRTGSKRLLTSHALDNAKQRLEAFSERNREVLDEYLRLRNEVRQAAANLGHLERSLRTLLRDLGALYE